jgi:hypothetical protein
MQVVSPNSRDCPTQAMGICPLMNPFCNPDKGKCRRKEGKGDA